jgi:hypothetical protein
MSQRFKRSGLILRDGASRLLRMRTETALARLLRMRAKSRAGVPQDENLQICNKKELDPRLRGDDRWKPR